MTTASALVSARIVLVDASGRLTNDGLKILSRIEAAIASDDGVSQVILGTPWVTYTPTFTGFGTVASVSIWSRRVGDSLHLRGKFTAGTPTAVEARMTLGFNGTNANVTSDATKVPSIQLAGLVVRNNNAATVMHYSSLIESNIGYITFGAQTSTTNALTKALGNAIILAGELMSIQAEIPISGWS